MFAKPALKAPLLVFILAGGVAAAMAGPASPRLMDLASRSAQATQTVPPALRAAFYRALAKDAGAAYTIRKDGCTSLPKSTLRGCFTRQGAQFTGAGSPLVLQLIAYGRNQILSAVKPVRPAVTVNRASYAYGNLTEWWRVLPIGFEQGFTIAKRPTGTGELVLALATSRQDAGAPKSGTLAWGKLRYGNLIVTDVNGKVVPAQLKSKGNRILIAVNDAHAAYPLTVDPMVWLEQKMTANDGEAGDLFGTSLVISGSTALVGAPYATVNDNPYQGAAYVFTESSGIWSQTQKLTANDGEELDEFGYSVALDNTTALVGAPNQNDTQGGVYVFTESAGIWTQSQEFSASDGQSGDFFGGHVALLGDAALVGAGYASVNGNAAQGAAYVFTKSGDTWTQEQKLTVSDGLANDQFGNSIAFDETNILIGAPYHAVNGNLKQGAAYMFTQSGGVWSQTQELVANDGAAANFFGWSVAVAGATALVGADHATINGHANQGAVYVFGNADGNWSQVQKLVASDGAASDNFGWSVALTNTIALVGANFATINGQSQQGAAYLYDNLDGTWSQAQKLTASDGAAGAKFGQAVAISGDNVLVGANWATINGNSSQGAAYFYGESDLGLTVSAPQMVGQGQQYINQTIATNNASATSPAVSATITVPAAASFISATTTQGSCSEASNVVTCDFGPIPGNAGAATANVTLKATGSPGTTINNTASVVLAQPALTASAPTQITSSQSCPAGYTTYNGTLAANGRLRGPSYGAPAGEENAILYAPAGFKLYARVDNSEWGSQRQQGFSGTEVHRWGPAGTYAWGVKSGDTGGAFTFCLNHP